MCRDPNKPNRVAEELLRWHFRQAALANMKGTGEPLFEHDFIPGSDMVGEILKGWNFELFSRLQEISQEDDELIQVDLQLAGGSS